jgi:hypothetical protein
MGCRSRRRVFFFLKKKLLIYNSKEFPIGKLTTVFQVNGRSGFINLSSADFQPSAGNQKIGDL